MNIKKYKRYRKIELLGHKVNDVKYHELKELTDTYLMGLDEMDNPWKDPSHRNHNKYNPKDRWLGKDGKYMIYQDEKNKILWVNYDKIWSFFESYFEGNYQKISEFIQGVLVMTYNCKVYATSSCNMYFYAKLVMTYNCKVYATDSDRCFNRISIGDDI